MFRKLSALRQKKGNRDNESHEESHAFSSPVLSTSTSAGRLTRRTSESEPGPLGLNVVYTPENGHKADIVFIHGLGGTSRFTWSKNKDPDLF
ncbi:uncharacterized protein PG986_000882 [Apiospora aurea]|uniref:Uncharacterized protein n=1 Tax=Apiospora aurea TaxID=335848 RepID=A0ABR1QVB0_9PEZI